MHERPSFLTATIQIAVLACQLTLTTLVLSGCGAEGDSDEGDTATDTVSASTISKDLSASKDHSANRKTGSGKSGATDSAFVDSEGRQWVAEGFPYDVWFPDPLAVVRQDGPVLITNETGTAPNADDGRGADEPHSPDPKPAASSGSTTNWKEVITAEVLDEEIKKINNRFRAKLQTVATYNFSYMALPPHIAAMTALAGIAVEHPDAVRWQAGAKHIRDLSAAMLAEKLMRGPKSYRIVQGPSEQINEILSGSPPAGLPQPAEGNNFTDFTDIGLLMKRLEIGAKGLKDNFGSADSLTKRAEEVKQEAQVLAALIKVVTTEGYGFSEDEDFLEFAKPMMEGCRKIADAVDAGNFEDYELALTQVTQACAKCHSTYR